jgi:hypothetical protein
MANEYDALRSALMQDSGNRKENFEKIVSQIEHHLYEIGSEGGIGPMNMDDFPNATAEEKTAYRNIYNYLSELSEDDDLALEGDRVADFRLETERLIGGRRRRTRRQKHRARKHTIKRINRKKQLKKK